MSYLTLDHTRREHYIETAVEDIKNSGIKFKSIVCTGLSGVLVAPEVAARLGKPIVIVRKNESSHGKPVEKKQLIGRYIVIDDFVETGSTIQRVIEQIDLNDVGEYVGAYFYRQGNHSAFRDAKAEFEGWFEAHFI
jgi:adenine/guanine phosphoribosyltransferase-like PRPP-binding protein